MSNWYKIDSNRQKKNLLVVDNYLHRLDRCNGHNEYYKCIKNCGGRAILKSQTTAIISKKHSHPIHGVELAEREFRNNLKVSSINIKIFRTPRYLIQFIFIFLPNKYII